MKKLSALLLAAVLLAAAPLGAQTIFYPAEVTISEDIVTIDGKQYFSHVVHDRQTLYSIGKAYGVSGLTIIDLNPSLNLDRRSIKAGDVLLIPVTEQALKALEEKRPDGISFPVDTLKRHIKKTTPAQADTTQVATDSLPVFIYDYPERINVCLLLPIDSESAANVRYLNYYFGSMLAARDLSRKGIKLDIRTIDTMSAGAWDEAEEAFCSSDVIIGPVSTSDIREALPLLPEGKFIVSPMDARTAELTRDYPVILAATPANAQALDAVRWMQEEKTEKDTLILVSETGVRIPANMALVRDTIRNAQVSNTVEVDYSVADGLEMNEWFGVHTHLGDTATLVMALSERDVFVNDVIRNVYLQNSLKHNVTIYGPAKTRSAETEEMGGAYLHNSVTYHIDYNRPEVIAFVNDYRALFHCEPDSFAFHGYDTMRYFAGICATYGRNWEQKLNKYTYSGLQTYFRFEEKEKTGHVNAGLRRVLYTPGFNIFISDK